MLSMRERRVGLWFGPSRTLVVKKERMISVNSRLGLSTYMHLLHVSGCYVIFPIAEYFSKGPMRDHFWVSW